MSATHPISGAATAVKATPAPSAHSSLADFLLVGAPGNAGDDFRAIVATWFGAANPAPAKTQAPAKDPAAKEPSDIRKGQDDKKSSDQASALAAHPELTVALLNTAQASIQNLPKPVTPEPSTKMDSVSLPDSDGDDMAAKLAGNSAADAGMTLSRAWTNSLFPAGKQQEMKASGALDSEGAKELPSNPGEGRTLLPQPSLDEALGKQFAPGGVQQVKEGAPAIPSLFGAGMPGKKSAEPTKPANARAQEQGVNGGATQNSTQAPNIAKPTLPADARVTANPNELRPVTTGTVPTVPVHEQTPLGTASQTSEVTATAAPQVSAAAVSLAAESKDVSGRPSANELSKITDRNDRVRSDKIRSDKVRDSKDTPLTSGLSGKPGSGPVGPVAPGPTTSGGNAKDLAGMAVPNHSGAHAKAEPAKQSPGASSLPAGLAEGDGPDEAIPTTASSPLTAKLVQGMSQSEFRVGMQSPEFGNIDIRTSVTRHLFSAQISVEHGDMAKSLATELPALYSKLADQHVPVANIVIQGHGLATSSGLAQHSQPQTWQPQSHHSNGNTTSSTVEAILPLMTEGFDSTGRLDIRI